MSLFEQQKFLSRLYTEPQFRSEFYADPDRVGENCGLTQDEIGELLLAARDEVDLFSRSLIWKRQREAAKMLPLTVGALDKEFGPAFDGFASCFLPRSIKKHLEDSVKFCGFVAAHADRFSKEAVDAATFEGTRLKFINGKTAAAYCWVRGLSNYAGNPGSTGSQPRQGKLLGLAVWLRFGKRTFHFII